MILSDDELEERLESPSNLRNKLVEIRTLRHGKEKGTNNIPPLVKELIAITSIQSNETQNEVAEAFGVSQEFISRTSRGLVGDDALDKNLQNKTTEARNKVRAEKNNTAHEAALDSLLVTLGCITPERLASIEKPEKLSKVASDLSRVVSNLKPKEDEADLSKSIKVVIFAPQMKQETHYETIDA